MRKKGSICSIMLGGGGAGNVSATPTPQHNSSTLNVTGAASVAGEEISVLSEDVSTLCAEDGVCNKVLQPQHQQQHQQQVFETNQEVLVPRKQ